MKLALLALVSHDLRAPLTSIRPAGDSLLSLSPDRDKAMLRDLHTVKEFCVIQWRV